MKKKDILRKLRKSKLFMIGFIGVVFMIGLCLIGPAVLPWDPLIGDLSERLVKPEWFTRGLNGHILGTDALGRDVLVRVLEGGRASLMISVSVVLLCTIIGTIVATISSYYSGSVDRVLMRICDMLMAVPQLMLAICVVAVMGSSFFNLIFTLSITGWTAIARVVRATGLSVRNTEYIKAAKVIGSGNVRIMIKEFLPNLMTPILIQSTQRFGGTILVEASMSYLGMGVPMPTPSWGTMISEGRDYLSTSPWCVVVPGIALMLVVLCFNFVGDGLRDVLDPKNKD